MVISSKMTGRCTGTTVSGNRCKNSANCHIHKEPCSICLSSISANTRRTLPCGHEFHTGCIDRLKASGSNQCPLCRKLFDVSQFKISLEIVNTRTNRTTTNDLPSETILDIFDGINFDFSQQMTELNFDFDTLQDLQALLNDIGVSNTDIDPAIFDTE